MNDRQLKELILAAKGKLPFDIYFYKSVLDSEIREKREHRFVTGISFIARNFRIGTLDADFVSVLCVFDKNGKLVANGYLLHKRRNFVITVSPFVFHVKRQIEFCIGFNIHYTHPLFCCAEQQSATVYNFLRAASIASFLSVFSQETPRSSLPR